MSTITLSCSIGDLPVLGGYLRLVSSGTWTATVECHSESGAPAEGSPASLVIVAEAKPGEKTAAPVTHAGTIRHAAFADGSAQLVVSIVGGKGLLASELAPSEHVTGTAPIPVGLVLRALADAVGETLAAGVEDALDAYTVPRWHRAGGSSGRAALELLIADVAGVEGVELGWRFLSSGELWVGVETWPESTSQARLIAPDLDDGTEIFAPSAPDLLPGTTIDGQRAIEVLYTLSPPALRARVRHAVPGDPKASPDASLYRASYLATVKLANADGTYNLTCDEARIGDLRSVPFRLGVPGAKVEIPVDSRVHVRFADGSPRGAYACDVAQDEEAIYALALVADAVNCGSLSGIANLATGIVSFVVTPPGGSPGASSATASLSGVITGPGHKYAKGVRGS